MATEAVGRANEAVAPASKTFRTLFHVIAISEKNVRVVVPGWKSRKRVTLEKDDLPKPIQDNLAVDYLFYAQADLNASSPEELVKSMTAFESGGILPKKQPA
ncbi:MAG TPA: hypothetical protein VKW06_06555 [Candidatus Angelobacter sp.]|nr:hypothetical protein [Candidatus Angelobacter sp.]